MEKLKAHLLELSFILILIKSLITEISLPSALIMITLVISIVYTKYFLVDKNKIHSDATKEELETVNKKLNTLMLAVGMKRG
jgi:uncharacterized membrane protein